MYTNLYLSTFDIARLSIYIIVRMLLVTFHSICSHYNNIFKLNWGKKYHWICINWSKSFLVSSPEQRLDFCPEIQEDYCNLRKQDIVLSCPRTLLWGPESLPCLPVTSQVNVLFVVAFPNIYINCNHSYYMHIFKILI